jgi:hypothetical protein
MSLFWLFQELQEGHHLGDQLGHHLHPVQVLHRLVLWVLLPPLLALLLLEALRHPVVLRLGVLQGVHRHQVLVELHLVLHPVVLQEVYPLHGLLEVLHLQVARHPRPVLQVVLLPQVLLEVLLLVAPLLELFLHLYPLEDNHRVHQCLVHLQLVGRPQEVHHPPMMALHYLRQSLPQVRIFIFSFLLHH